MTTELTRFPASLAPRPSLIREWELPAGESSSDWDQPLDNPDRSALLASAFEKLADSERRFERLQARLAEFPARPAQPSLS